MQVNSKTVANFERPKCSAYDSGKVHCQTDKVKTTNNNPMKDQDIMRDNLLPGQMVSTDHSISWGPGRLYHTKVKSDPSEMFSGGYALLTIPIVI